MKRAGWEGRGQGWIAVPQVPFVRSFGGTRGLRAGAGLGGNAVSVRMGRPVPSGSSFVVGANTGSASALATNAERGAGLRCPGPSPAPFWGRHSSADPRGSSAVLGSPPCSFVPTGGGERGEPGWGVVGTEPGRASLGFGHRQYREPAGPSTDSARNR